MDEPTSFPYRLAFGNERPLPVWLKRVAAVQVGNGDLALATAPLHARRTVRDSARVSLNLNALPLGMTLTISLCLSGPRLRFIAFDPIA